MLLQGGLALDSRSPIVVEDKLRGNDSCLVVRAFALGDFVSIKSALSRDHSSQQATVMSRSHANHYDTIIVGAGSAGCVLAYRLSENPNHRVLLLEAGGSDWHPFLHMPAGLAKMVNRKGVNWDYYTEPEPNLDNRKLWWPRGKVLGGSSSINAMCYIRGHRDDYNQWAEAGNPGWGWDDVLPYFRRSQNQERGENALHGGGGLLNVQDLRHTNPLSQAFIDAATSLGYPLNEDFNGVSQDGFGYYQVTQKNGARCSTAAGYLREARGRENLTVLTRAMTQKVLLDGARARGVEYLHRGKRVSAEASQQVVLCGGAINSPQLLLLSGIGPGDELHRHGIAVAQELPGVGANLQDHLDVCLLQHCTQPITYDRTNDVAIALRYLLFRNGIGTSNIAESGGFVRSPMAVDHRADLQFHFVPAMLDDHGRNKLPGRGYTLHVCGLRPKSRGRIGLHSADPAAKAAIYANYLSDPFDLATLVEGFRISRDIFASAPLGPFRADEIYPGETVTERSEIERYIRRKAESIYHPVGTCKMGVDGQAVVDPELQVHGIKGLRVVDASIIPTLIGGNTNAPVVMIAERASDLILGRAGARLPQAAVRVEEQHEAA